jgi:uncharacterized protein YndB with AHSA1/START domain
MAREDSPDGARPALDGLEVRHETFVVSRLFDASPRDVFAAFADDTLRRRWFKMPGSGATYDHQFRVGAGETARSTFSMPDLPPERLEYRSTYVDISPHRRLVFAYESAVDGVVRWASLATVELHDETGRTRLEWTEQVAFLVRTGDGSADLPHLRGATTLRLNGLAGALAPL